jgi:cysteine desulfurase
VLLAMGIDPHLAHGSLRLTIGPETSEVDVDAALAALETVLPRLRTVPGAHPKAAVPA